MSFPHSLPLGTNQARDGPRLKIIPLRSPFPDLATLARAIAPGFEMHHSWKPTRSARGLASTKISSSAPEKNRKFPAHGKPELCTHLLNRDALGRLMSETQSHTYWLAQTSGSSVDCCTKELQSQRFKQLTVCLWRYTGHLGSSDDRWLTAWSERLRWNLDKFWRKKGIHQRLVESVC